MRLDEVMAQADEAVLAGHLAEAETFLHTAVGMDDVSASVLCKLGAVLFLQGKVEEAQQWLERAVTCDAANYEAWYNLGCVAQKVGDIKSARDCFIRAVKTDGTSLNPRVNLAVVEFELGNTEVAIALSYSILLDYPKEALVFANLSGFLRAHGAVEEARLCAEAGLGLDPVSPVVLKALGNLAYDLRNYAEAARWFSLALRQDPDNPSLHLNIGMAALAMGDFVNGWREYEWRRAMPGHGGYGLSSWQGEALEGKTVLLFAEQGHGDTLQFVRLAQDVKARGGEVKIAVQPALVRLLKQNSELGQVVDAQSPVPAADYCLPLMSLPFMLGLTLEHMPRFTPYVFPVNEEVAQWGRRLAHEKRPKIGVVWAGDSRSYDPELNRTDARRSLPLGVIAPLFRDDTHHAWFSLQKGKPAEQAKAWPQLIDYSDEWQDFADTAAFIANLDLVIAVDTAVAHLAAAMGRPTWLLSRYDACWRWLGNQETSPWYPSLRIFGQSSPGNWTDVIQKIAANLSLHVPQIALNQV